MRDAFKEWAIIVEALGLGEQILIFRKGGIHEGRGGFQLEHREFFLFPTWFHQQRERVIEQGRIHFDQMPPGLEESAVVRLTHFGRVAWSERLENRDQMRGLLGQHWWREEVLEERFDWGKEQGIWAFALRVFHLPQTVELPLLARYGGCKSWVSLAEDISTEGSTPVLGEQAFASKVLQFRSALKKAGQEGPFGQNQDDYATIAEPFRER